LVHFWRDLQWKMLVYFMDIWYIFWPFGILYGYLVYFGILFQEKSGNPAYVTCRTLYIKRIFVFF
jgi:hypothetical protein